MLKMKRALLVAGMTAAMTASMAVAQNGRTGAPDEGDIGGSASAPCAGDMDTPVKCVLCFDHFLQRCDRFENDDVRKACVAGATTFFEWCMGQFDSDETRSQWVNAQWPEFQSWPVGTQLERPFIWPEGADRIETWVRIKGDKEHNKTPIVEENPDGSWNVVIDWPEMSLGDNGSVVIVLVWFDGETIVEAMADVVLLTSDMDGDGEVRGDDLEIILHNFATGRLDMRELIRALR